MGQEPVHVLDVLQGTDGLDLGLIAPLEGGHKEVGTQGVDALVILVHRSVLHGHLFGRRVQGGDPLTKVHLDVPVGIPLGVIQRKELRLGRLIRPVKHMLGQLRPLIGQLILLGDHGDRPRLIPLSDGLGGVDGSGTGAKDEIPLVGVVLDHFALLGHWGEMLRPYAADRTFVQRGVKDLSADVAPHLACALHRHLDEVLRPHTADGTFFQRSVKDLLADGAADFAGELGHDGFKILRTHAAQRTVLHIAVKLGLADGAAHLPRRLLLVYGHKVFRPHIAEGAHRLIGGEHRMTYVTAHLRRHRLAVYWHEMLWPYTAHWAHGLVRRKHRLAHIALDHRHFRFFHRHIIFRPYVAHRTQIPPGR